MLLLPAFGLLFCGVAGAVTDKRVVGVSAFSPRRTAAKSPEEAGEAAPWTVGGWGKVESPEEHSEEG